MAPFQQRVVDEKAELDKKLNSLLEFFKGPTFEELNDGEKERLCRQATLMRDYSNVLGERIQWF